MGNRGFNPYRKDILKAWIPSLIWLAIIAVESTDLLSSSREGHFLYSVLTFFFGSINFEKFLVWNDHLRKLGHFVGYFVLSWFQFAAWRATIFVPNAGNWALRWARISFLMTVMVATLDEWHQSLIPSRTGRFHDVVLDSSAALVAQLLIWLWLRSGRSAPLIGGAEVPDSGD